VREFLNKEMQYNLFKQLLIELLDYKYKYNTIVFMAPLPCYLDRGCCEDKDHTFNHMSQSDYRMKQEAAVFGAMQNIENFAFRNGLCNCVTISTWGKVKNWRTSGLGQLYTERRILPGHCRGCGGCSGRSLG
jgi:hypothetical protein